MITLEQIRTNLQEAIRQSGMSQTALAKALNIKQQTIACYLQGKAMPALDTFANLCALLDVDANDILCIDEFTKSKNIHISDSFNNNSGNINFKA